jgi:hypothetical protein
MKMIKKNLQKNKLLKINSILIFEIDFKRNLSFVLKNLKF